MKLSLNKMEWLVIAMVSTVLFAILSNLWEGFIYFALVCFLYPFGLGLVMIGYAIINTIKDFRE